MKEGSYGSQTRVSASYKAIMAVDNEVQVSGAGRMVVETSILYPSFDHTKSKRKFSAESKNVQDRRYTTTLVTRVYCNGRVPQPGGTQKQH